jgi:hypothetical protein
MRKRVVMVVAALAAVGLAASATAQGTRRPALYFSEAWNSTRGDSDDVELSQANVKSKDVTLHLYGKMRISGANDGGEVNPPHTYTGLCDTACGVTLSKKGFYANLGGPTARIRINSKMSGFHVVRPLIRLADGTLLVGDQSTGVIGPDYLINEFNTAQLRWIKFDEKSLTTTGLFLDKVDLTKVDEIGYIDLIPGSGHGQGGFADIGLFELYALSSAH